jgi:hypothetical protein
MENFKPSKENLEIFKKIEDGKASQLLLIASVEYDDILMAKYSMRDMCALLATNMATNKDFCKLLKNTVALFNLFEAQIPTEDGHGKE